MVPQVLLISYFAKEKVKYGGDNVLLTARQVCHRIQCVFIYAESMQRQNTTKVDTHKDRISNWINGVGRYANV